MPKRSFNNCPVSNSSISRAAAEVEISIKIVLGPADLPDSISMLPTAGTGLEAGRGALGVEVVDSNITVIETNHNHVGIERVNIKTENAAPSRTNILRE